MKIKTADIIAHKCLGTVEVQRITLHTLSTIFGILKTEALPVLPFIVSSTFELLGKATDEESPDIHIHDACLALLDSIAIHIPLAMSGKILQQTLHLTLASIAAGIESKANVVDKLCQSIAHHARPGDLLPIIEQASLAVERRQPMLKHADPETFQLSAAAQQWYGQVLDKFAKIDDALARRLGEANRQRFEELRQLRDPDPTVDETAPIKLQAHGDKSEPISFRNIWVREVKPWDVGPHN